ncbi:MAG: membrane dipeptidase, partial [Clostridia bacterium]|nr:membrane dipeptidase [Clostridia bacterium]
MISLTWNNENEIGHPAKYGSKEGLKPFGIKLLQEMDKLGIYADVSHLNEAGFWDIVKHMNLPPVASHSNAYELCNHPRNLKDDQIRAIIEKKGYIGINFYSNFLARGRDAVLDDVVR